MRTIGILIGAAGLALATGAIAADPETDAQQEAPKERKICKSEKMTGSLTRVRRTCLTQAQWDEVAERSRRATNDFVRNSQNSQSPGRGQTLSAD